MDAMVMREADVLWNAVSYTATEHGYVASGPETDEAWLDLRYAALSLAEATNSLLIPGRHANRPGAEAIDELIASQHDVWTTFAGSLRAAAVQTIDASQDRCYSPAPGNGNAWGSGNCRLNSGSGIGTRDSRAGEFVACGGGIVRTRSSVRCMMGQIFTTERYWSGQSADTAASTLMRTASGGSK